MRRCPKTIHPWAVHHFISDNNAHKEQKLHYNCGRRDIQQKHKKIQKTYRENKMYVQVYTTRGIASKELFDAHHASDFPALLLTVSSQLSLTYQWHYEIYSTEETFCHIYRAVSTCLGAVGPPGWWASMGRRGLRGGRRIAICTSESGNAQLGPDQNQI